jgi:uncharacterized protein
MRINLAEIPEEGESFIWNNQTGEINKDLADLIGKKTYVAEFTIRPLNSKDFELTGSIKTGLPEQCARCGIDFDFPVNAKFREFLIPQQDQPRGSKYAKVNHLSDIPSDLPETLEYQGQHFDMGEYLHEIVALAAPFNPAGPENDKGDCSICNIPVKGRSFSYDEKMPEEKPANPFAALKNIKLN